MNSSLNFFENSIFFRFIFFFIISLKNSSFFKLLNGEIKINLYNTFFLSKIIMFFEKTLQKFSFLKHYFNKTTTFCLNKASKKVILILLFFIITNEFFRNNILAEIFYLPVLLVLFLILMINFINLFENDKKILTYIFLIFFFIKIFYFFGAYNFVEFSDERAGYSELSWRVLKYWFYDSPILSSISGAPLLEGLMVNVGQYFYYFIALVYYFFGKHFIIAKLFSLFIHLITGILIYLLAKDILDKKTALISTILFYSLFSINLFSIAVLLESFSTFLLVLFFLLLIKLNELLFKNNFKSTFLIIFIYLIYYIETGVRDYVAQLLPIAFFTWAFFYAIKNYKTNVFFKNFILFFVIILLFFSFLKLNITQEINFVEEKTSLFLEKTNNYRNIPSDVGRLEFFEGADTSTINNAINFLPIGLTYVFFSILPSEVKNFDLWGFFILDTIFWYFLLPFIFLGSIYALKNKPFETSPIIAFIIMMIVGHALVEGNFGNLLRHAVQFKALMLIFGAYGVTNLIK